MLIEVAAWREQEAQSRDVPRGRVLKDDAVGDIATHAPTTLEKLANLRSLPRGFDRSKWGGDIVAAVKRGLARDQATLPKLEKPRNNSNGAATVELLKVLLRMTSERHAVASKVIATVDDLEQIAADDNADVAALQGWRRELFGEAALALKHGKLALAIEKGRVVRVDRTEGETSQDDRADWQRARACPSQGGAHAIEHISPIPGGRLPKQAHGRIPGAVVAIEQPAPVRRIRQRVQTGRPSAPARWTTLVSTRSRDRGN